MTYFPPCIWRLVYELDPTYHDYFREHVLPYIHAFKVYKIDQEHVEDPENNTSYLLLPAKSWWAVGEPPEFAVLMVDDLDDPFIFIAHHFTEQPYSLYFEHCSLCRMVPSEVITSILEAYHSI